MAAVGNKTGILRKFIQRLDNMAIIKEKKAKVSMTKDALYTAIASNGLVALALSAQLTARSVVKRDPTTQSFHLIGFGFILFMAMGFLFFSLVTAWNKFCNVPLEERRGGNWFLRLITVYLLIIASRYFAVNVIIFLFNMIKYR